MIGAILKIVFGLFLWKIVPGWIEFGSPKSRSFIQLCLNIVGILIVIAGAISLSRSLSVVF